MPNLINQITFINSLSSEEYINHCGEVSVLLDPLFFGAGNSFYESLFYGTPTISLPTNYTKSRLVLGAYNQMKISDLRLKPIVKDIDEYIVRSVTVANDRNLLELKKTLQAKAEKNLYEYNKSIDDLDKIFKKIVN